MSISMGRLSKIRREIKKNPSFMSDVMFRAKSARFSHGIADAELSERHFMDGKTLERW